MVNLHHHISTLYLVLVAIFASLTGCSSDSEHLIGGDGEGGGDDDKLQISLRISIPLMSDSRANAYGINDYENAIDLNGKDYRVLLFSTDNKLLFSLDPSSFDIEENNSSLPTPDCHSYILSAEVGKELIDYTDLKLVLLANWGTYPTMDENTTIDDLAGFVAEQQVSKDPSTTYEASGILTPGDGKHIPMFGLKECSNLLWVNGMLTWAGDMWLLRAVAKIEVRAAEGTPAIESVVLTHYNKRGTCAPMNVYEESQYVNANKDDYKPLGHLTLPGGNNDPGSPYSITPDENNVFTVYVPEYQILADPTQPKGELVDDFSRLQVRFKDLDYTYDVDFKYYTEDAAMDNHANVGDYFDIKRNYYYRYNLRLNKFDLLPEVRVIPYIETILNPDFGLIPEEPDQFQDYEPVYSRHGDILFYTDGTAPDYKDATGFFAPDFQTEIENPLEHLTSEGWWSIEGMVEGRKVIYFYYDPVEKVQYAPDRRTKVRTVFSYTEVGYLSYLELDADGTTETGVDNYYDAWHDLWYDLPPTKGYYVDKTEIAGGIGYVYNTNNVLVVNRFTGSPVQFVSTDKSIRVENGKKYLIDSSTTLNGGKVQVEGEEGDIILKIILLESPYPDPLNL